MEELGCTFHLVQYFEECSPNVIVNCEFTFWDLHGANFPILIGMV
jgi:hypothetical protein